MIYSYVNKWCICWRIFFSSTKKYFTTFCQWDHLFIVYKMHSNLWLVALYKINYWQFCSIYILSIVCGLYNATGWVFNLFTFSHGPKELFAYTAFHKRCKSFLPKQFNDDFFIVHKPHTQIISSFFLFLSLTLCMYILDVM